MRDRVRGGGARSFVICIVILFSLSFVLRFRLSKTTMFYSIQNTKTKPNVRLSFPTGTAHTRHVRASGPHDGVHAEVVRI